MDTIFVKLLDNASENYKVTFTGKETSYDLYSSKDVQIQPLNSASVGTGVAIATKDNSCRFFYPRSIINKSKIVLHECVDVIDITSATEIELILFNPTNEVITVSRGDKLIQLVRPSDEPFEIKCVDELPYTDTTGRWLDLPGKRRPM